MEARPSTPTFIKIELSELLQSGLFTSFTVAAHRDIYKRLIYNFTQQRRMKIAGPGLNRSSIWKWLAREGAAKASEDSNHNQLPTKLRQIRLNRPDDDNYPVSNQNPETEDHLMFPCPARQNMQAWL